VKIDKSFIDNCLTDPKDAGIVKAIITIAHHLKMKVIAEGVENKKQAEFLKKLKCDMGQGDYFSKPLPAEKLEKKWRGKKSSL
jgi:EAL domain-containing protein (putative c-di-GMP-specific phosphodiesterase class I)